ncbi:MAG: MlaD family protein [Solirubrobacterales bacterium]
MSKKAPSTAQLLVIVGFALSCFGILLFLWVTFGGSTPFRAKPFQLKIPFDEATQLAQQSDVRISGVNVGKVQSIDLAPNGDQALATVDVDDKYAPLPESTRAILRTKTLLGETYIELTPGSSEQPRLDDGATLPEANVAQSVQLDEIFRTFDPETRAAFQTWMQEAAIGVQGQGQNLSYGIGQLEPTFTELAGLLRVLDTQNAALGQLFRDGAKTFTALRGREGQLADLIQSSNAVFQTTARRNADIEALFRAFPTFLDESKLTLERLRTFSEDADPLFTQLVPAAEELSPTLIALSRVAPEAKGLFEGLIPVIERAPRGFRAGRVLFRDEFPPLLRAAEPFARNLNPVLTGLKLYRREITSLFANVAASANVPLTETLPDGVTHPTYLRATGPLNPETLATYASSRLKTNRTSAYSHPKWAEELLSGLPGFETRQCGSGLSASLDPTTTENEAFRARLKQPENPGDPEEEEKLDEEVTEFFDRLKQFAFAGQESTTTLPTPACTQQKIFGEIYGSGGTTYQQTNEQPAP